MERLRALYCGAGVREDLGVDGVVGHLASQDSGDDVGYVTSAFWSPNLSSNIALAVMPRFHWRRGTRVKVQLPRDGIVDAEVVRVPFVNPTKERPKTAL